MGTKVIKPPQKDTFINKKKQILTTSDVKFFLSGELIKIHSSHC
jgi:hypothetical protein